MMRYYKFVLRPFIDKHRRLIERRGGIRSHFQLMIRFGEIQADPYVKMSREEQGE